jgi:hypothetical protein
VWARSIPELAQTSFSIQVVAAEPIVAERALYFGGTVWLGGHLSLGAPEPGSRWLCPEGATGSYFDTFVLVGNPSSSVADIVVDYLTDSGRVVTDHFEVAPLSRLTINVESRSPVLESVAVSTVVTSTVPVVVERATYWGGDFTRWLDGHSSLGATAPRPKWGVADVRAGGAEAFETWLLLSNEHPFDIEVDVTQLPEFGPAATTRITVPARSRYTLHANAYFPGAANQRFGVRLASVGGDGFAVERAQYWNAGGVSWAGGASSGATPLPD